MNEGRRLITISADGEPSGNPLSFIGLSTDIKPTTGIPKGSSFTEIDTSKIYHFDGSSWVEFNYRVTQSGSNVEELYYGEYVNRTRITGLAYYSWNFNNGQTVTIAAGAVIDETDYKDVNGFSSLAFLVRDISGASDFELTALWIADKSYTASYVAPEVLVARGTSRQYAVGSTTTKSQHVKLRIYNNDIAEETLHIHGLLRA